MKAISLLITVFTSNLLAAAPATLPSTRPAKSDLSSPEATIRSLADVLDQDDADGYRKIVAPQTDEQRREVDNEVRMMLLGQQLILAARKHIGEAEAAKLASEEGLGMFGMPTTGHDGDELRRMLDDQSIQWKYDGEEAVLGEVSPQIRVRKIDGRWRM